MQTIAALKLELTLGTTTSLFANCKILCTFLYHQDHISKQMHHQHGAIINLANDFAICQHMAPCFNFYAINNRAMNFLCIF
jgi:hypothetical protein